MKALIKILIIPVVLLIVSGCETLASKDAAAGCQLADIASTHYALHHNPALAEQNPLPVPVLDVIKLALAWFIKFGVSDEEWNSSWVGIRSFITVVGCGAAISNVRVGNQN